MRHQSRPDKTAFKLFDFFGNCDYFETEFNYDDSVLKLPPRRQEGGDGGEGPIFSRLKGRGTRP